jgi:hypothetical protein
MTRAATSRNPRCLDPFLRPFHDPTVDDQVKRPATYDDLAAVPAHLVAELIGGQLQTSPRPAVLHTRAASRLEALLDGPFDRGVGGPGG